MSFDAILARFAAQAPVATMVRAAMANILSPRELDTIEADSISPRGMMGTGCLDHLAANRIVVVPGPRLDLPGIPAEFLRIEKCVDQVPDSPARRRRRRRLRRPARQEVILDGQIALKGPLGIGPRAEIIELEPDSLAPLAVGVGRERVVRVWFACFLRSWYSFRLAHGHLKRRLEVAEKRAQKGVGRSRHRRRIEKPDLRQRA